MRTYCMNDGCNGSCVTCGATALQAETEGWALNTPEYRNAKRFEGWTQAQIDQEPAEDWRERLLGW